MISRHGMERGVQGFAIKHTVVMVMLDILALFFYASHLPEKWWPHTFDLWVSRPSYSLAISYGKLTVGFWGYAGGKPPDLSHSHRRRSNCLLAGIAEGDAKALCSRRRAGCFSTAKSYQSFDVSGLPE